MDRLAGDPLAEQLLRMLAWYAPDGIPRTLLDRLADPPAVLGAVGRLAAYSMLTAGPGALTMHRLVQAVTRTPDPGDPHRDPSHARPETDTQDTAYLLNQAGVFLKGQGQPGRAATYLQRALADRVRLLGADHPRTLTSRNNLATAYDDAGELGRAIPLYEQTLADSVRVLSADHPQTKIVRGNLAAARQHPNSAPADVRAARRAGKPWEAERRGRAATGR